MLAEVLPDWPAIAAAAPPASVHSAKNRKTWALMEKLLTTGTEVNYGRRGLCRKPTPGNQALHHE
jgi:hypothetical protein